MARYQCFLIEPTTVGVVYLRRYARIQKRTPAEMKCPGSKLGIHEARVFFGDATLERSTEFPGTWQLKDNYPAEPPHDDPRWPTQCETCGLKFDENDEYQLFERHLYNRVDTGEMKTLDAWGPGAMWDAQWWRDSEGKGSGPDGLSLYVRLPDGTDWFIDGPASNCTCPEVKHNCWVREGTPPNINIIGGANICGVGGGSIQSTNYHGFLRNGWLED